MLRVAVLLAMLTGTAGANDRVLTAPTAVIPDAGEVTASGALDRHGAVALDASYGLGGIAEVELAALDSDARGNCLPECEPLELVTATFRMGARQDAWFAGQPALALGFRTTIGDGHRAKSAYVIATRTISLVTLHAGAELLTAAGEGAATAPVRLRPIGGFELVPPTLPKTTLLADVIWEPTFVPRHETSELAFTWGVRYQALRWAALELAVRHDQRAFGDPDVFVRVAGTWGTGYAPR